MLTQHQRPRPGPAVRQYRGPRHGHPVGAVRQQGAGLHCGRGHTHSDRIHGGLCSCDWHQRLTGISGQLGAACCAADGSQLQHPSVCACQSGVIGCCHYCLSLVAVLEAQYAASAPDCSGVVRRCHLDMQVIDLTTAEPTLVRQGKGDASELLD